MHVRPSGPDDAAAIADIQVRSFQAGYAAMQPRDVLAALDPAERVPLWREREAIVVVDDDDVVLGVAQVGASDEPSVGEIYRFFVDPEHWGRGVGQALMREALAQLRDEAFDAALLWVHAENDGARRFYEAGGWQPDGAAKEQESLGRMVTVLCYRRRV
jgi:GNAT superfamily N-acetyltransferase